MPDDKDKTKKKPPGKPRDREDPPGLFPEHSAYDLEPIVIPAHEKLHATPESEPEDKPQEREYKPLPEHSVFELEPIVVPENMKLSPAAHQLPDESNFELPPVDHNSKLMPMDTYDAPKVEPKPKEPLKNIDRASVFAPESPQPEVSDTPVLAPEPPAFAPEMPSLGQQQAFQPSSPFPPSQPSFPGAKPPPPPGRGPASTALPYLWNQGQISNATSVAAQALAGSYNILDTIGQGGMAIVYKARQENTDRLVAIKTLKDTSPEVMKRFLREVEAHARLKHANIVEAIDCVEAGNLAFLVMEYIDGISLQERLRQDGRIESAEELASILIQICNALEHAHQKKIIHRDLKSGNFLLQKDDHGGTLVKILDFGIAKIQDDTQRLTIEGKSLGSPLYMSPEQCTGASLTPSSDVYSLGVVAYEMATGRLPYQRTSIVEIMTAHCDPNIRPEPLDTYRPDLPGIAQLDQVLQKALETKIENRFRNMHQFRQGIEFWIDAVRQGKTQAAMPDEIMVNKIDPEEARSNEIKKSMYQLMEVRREQLGKTTTTLERGKFASESAPPRKRAKLMGQLILVLSAFIILTLGIAALAVTNMDYVNSVLAKISKTVETMLGRSSSSQEEPAPSGNPVSGRDALTETDSAPETDAPPVAPPAYDTGESDSLSELSEPQKQNSNPAEVQTAPEGYGSSNTDDTGQATHAADAERTRDDNSNASQTGVNSSDAGGTATDSDKTSSSGSQGKVPAPEGTVSDTSSPAGQTKVSDTHDAPDTQRISAPKASTTTKAPAAPKAPTTNYDAYENFDPE